MNSLNSDLRAAAIGLCHDKELDSSVEGCQLAPTQGGA
jgi:hypothetical protein